MEKEYTIFSFASLKDIADRHRQAGVIYSPDEFILERLRSLAYFLEENKLTTRKLIDGRNQISKDFILKSTDLNEFGKKVFRKGYNGWMTNAQKRPPNDISAFIRALKKVNSTSQPQRPS